MSNKLSALTAKTVLSGTDLLYTVFPGDADPDRKITAAELAASLHALLEVSSPPASETSAGTKGQWHWDAAAKEPYQCVATNTWIKIRNVVTTFTNS